MLWASNLSDIILAKLAYPLSDVMFCYTGITNHGQTSVTGQNLGRVFNSKGGCKCAMHLCCFEVKWPSLKLKTRPKQLLHSLPFAFALPKLTYLSINNDHPHFISERNPRSHRGHLREEPERMRVASPLPGVNIIKLLVYFFFITHTSDKQPVQLRLIFHIFRSLP
jgi:hypothetical protein